MRRATLGLAVAVAFLSLGMAAWAAESEDVQQVRDLIYKEIEGHHKADPDQIMSCYADGFVGYWADEKEPDRWFIWIVGLDSLRSQYAEGGQSLEEQQSRWPGHRTGSEVLHVQVVQDRAIASTKGWSSIPDSTARRTLNRRGESGWMLAKQDGEWKITSFVGHTPDREVILWPPE